MLEVILRGKHLRLDPRSAIGKGGEADVYAIDGGRALKVFKDPSHPDYQGLPGEQAAARERLALYQRKLPLFPLPLPSRVVQPEDLATLPGGAIAGYAMRRIDGAVPLARYGDRAYREASTRDEDVAALFVNLHATVTATHRAGVIIGDFNDLNVLVQDGGQGQGREQGQEAYLIDADSYGVGPFPCQVFTPRFTDPTLCVAQGANFVLAQSRGTDADWYAFAVLLMQSLLFVDPYGGVYRAPNAGSGGRPLSSAARMRQRITVFHPDVRYPRPARPCGVLPDELRAYFEDTFVRDQRGPFPLPLLGVLHWVRCPACGNAHARPSCPTCRRVVAAPMAMRHGAVRRHQIFETEGHIVCAALQEDVLRLAARTATGLVREVGGAVADAGWTTSATVRVQGQRTVVAAGGLALIYGTGGSGAVGPERLAVDQGEGATPLIEATAAGCYWISGGTLWRDGRFGPERIGDVIPETTMFWVGPTFGLGFYRAGTLARAFIFDALHGGLNDGVPLNLPTSHLVDAHCAFAEQRAWLFLTENSGGQTVRRCVVIGRAGGVEAAATASGGDGSWLDLGGAAGACAVGSALFVPTDTGIVRVDLTAGCIAQTRAFPDTEPFVDSTARLFPGPGGLYAVGSQRADLLLLS